VSRRRLLLGLIIPLLLALTGVVVIQYVRVVYAVLWPGVANGTTVTVSGVGSTSWGYYMGFGKMTLSVTTSGGSVSVYVAPVNLYTFASTYNLSALGTSVNTGYGTYYPCGRYGLIIYGGVVIPVEVSTYQGLYVYLPTNAKKLPLTCYSQWSSAVGTNPILTFDGSQHMNVAGTVYVNAYTYSATSGLVPTTYRLYTMSSATQWSPTAAYGSYGKTNIDGVWYLQMVAVYVSGIASDVTLTARASS